MVKEIICRNGEVVRVDDEDHLFLSRFTWYMIGDVNKDRAYPSCLIYGTSTKRFIPMHQLIMAGHKGGDHIDGNRFNNQKSNLRESTYQQNGWNARKPVRSAGRECTSKYKGVSYRPLKGKPRWLAFFKYVEQGKHKSTGRIIYVGYFDNEEDAARAYNVKVKEMRGKWAWQNPIPPSTHAENQD